MEREGIGGTEVRKGKRRNIILFNYKKHKDIKSKTIGLGAPDFRAFIFPHIMS